LSNTHYSFLPFNLCIAENDLSTPLDFDFIIRTFPDNQLFMHLLSKSTFISGLQCEKKLYLQKYRRDLLPAVATVQQLMFDQGSKVGVLAQELFPGGKDATPESYYDFGPAIEQTKQWMDAGVDVIYEAAFLFNEVLAAVDVLVRDGDRWKAYEVKGSTQVKEVYLNDAAIQYYLMTNSGLEISDISIIHINNAYVLDGELDIQQLFTIESVMSDVLERQASIPQKIEELKGVLKQKEAPVRPIGPHCNDPYSCDFKHHCWSHIPDYSVFNINRLSSVKKWDLYSKGIKRFDEIPPDYDLGSNQWMQVHSDLKNESVIDKNKITRFLEGLNYPLYYLDFETFQTAIPMLQGTKPFQGIVFQYSLHTQNEPGGELTHKEFLAHPSSDTFLPDLTKQLIRDCGTAGDIIVYNQGFEMGKIRNLIELFPAHEHELTGLLNRVVDLMIPFQQRWYYTPEMRGSYSIKYVLPALVPELSYADLAIQEGGTASAVFSQMMLGLFDGDEEETRNNLLEYCKLDTLAMVRVVGKLKI
jgi:hypothetical protein